MVKPLEQITVSYTTVKGKKVSFKAPIGTILDGSVSKIYNNDKFYDVEDGFSRFVKNNTNLGKVSEENHRLMTAIRMADGRPDLSYRDTEILANLAASTTTANKKYSKYINKFLNGAGECTTRSNLQFNLGDAYAHASNKKTNKEYFVLVNVPSCRQDVDENYRYFHNIPRF